MSNKKVHKSLHFAIFYQMRFQFHTYVFIEAIAWAMFTLILLPSLFHSILAVLVIVIIVAVLRTVIEFLKKLSGLTLLSSLMNVIGLIHLQI